MKIFSRRTFLISAFAISGAASLGYFTTPEPDESNGRAITCPFLAMDPPEARNIWAFARSCETNGMAYSMALFVAAQITVQQKDILALLRHEAPDIYSLHQVPGVSHADRYGLYIVELRPLAQKVAVNGRLSMQDLVELKKWMAQQEGVEIIESSRIETALAFVRSGGDFDSWTVDMIEFFTLIAGNRPAVDEVVTLRKLEKARDAARWGDV